MSEKLTLPIDPTMLVTVETVVNDVRVQRGMFRAKRWDDAMSGVKDVMRHIAEAGVDFAFDQVIITVEP